MRTLFYSLKEKGHSPSVIVFYGRRGTLIGWHRAYGASVSLNVWYRETINPNSFKYILSSSNGHSYVGSYVHMFWALCSKSRRAGIKVLAGVAFSSATFVEDIGRRQLLAAIGLRHQLLGAAIPTGREKNKKQKNRLPCALLSRSVNLLLINAKLTANGPYLYLQNPLPWPCNLITRVMPIMLRDPPHTQLGEDYTGCGQQEES